MPSLQSGSRSITARTAWSNCLDLRVPAGTVYGFLGATGPASRRPSRCCWGWPSPAYGRVELLGHDVAELASRGTGPHCLSGGRASALRLDDRRRSGSVRPLVPCRPLESAAARPDSRPLRDPSPAKLRRLSNGQRANVALALAIAPDPDLLILDDPTLGLDTVARRDFLMSMIHLVQRQGRTILFSSHILADVERVADRIGILVDGVLRVDCPTEHFKESVSKLVLEFAGRPPAFPGCAGLVQAWEVGHRLELVIVNFGTGAATGDRIAAPLAWDVAGLNLEDAFVDYTRGPRRSLPAFGEETPEGHPSTSDRGAA